MRETEILGTHGGMALNNLNWVDLSWEIKDENESATQKNWVE